MDIENTLTLDLLTRNPGALIVHLGVEAPSASIICLVHEPEVAEPDIHYIIGNCLHSQVVIHAPLPPIPAITAPHAIDNLDKAIEVAPQAYKQWHLMSSPKSSIRHLMMSVLKTP